MQVKTDQAKELNMCSLIKLFLWGKLWCLHANSTKCLLRSGYDHLI